RVLADGSMATDVGNDTVWIGSRQAMFATMAVAVMPAISGRSELDRAVWAPLNHPLRAWPDAAWFAASDAVSEVPVGVLPSALADYDTAVSAVLSTTMKRIDDIGTYGLMTYGSFPRLW